MSMITSSADCRCCKVQCHRSQLQCHPLDVGYFYPRGRKSFIGLNEKGGKHHEVPLHHKTLEYLDAYIEATGLAGQKGTSLFRSMGAKADRSAKSG